MTAKEPLRAEEPELVNQINMLEADLSPPAEQGNGNGLRISLPSSRVTSRPIK